MSQVIQVRHADQSTIFTNTTPAGVYRVTGGVWVAGGGGSYPIFISTYAEFDNLISEQRVLDSTSSGGVSESALLKAIAISQRPELAKELLP